VNYLLLFIIGLGTGLSGAMIPGPLFLYTFSQSLKKDMTVGLRIAFGHILIEALFVIFIFVGFRNFLSSEAFMRVATNGKEAIKCIEKKVPNIVLLDINMPVMDGIETLKHIRENYGDLPVIMITAEIERLPALQELGISGFFPKEGTLEQLEALLEPVIRMHAKMKRPS